MSLISSIQEIRNRISREAGEAITMWLSLRTIFAENFVTMNSKLRSVDEFSFCGIFQQNLEINETNFVT